MSRITYQFSKPELRVIDARGPRFSALITTFVLIAALAVHSLAIISFQLIVFGIGAFLGPQFTPYATIFRKVVRPRLSGEVPMEDVRPPRFAQRIGFIFALVATASLLAHLSPLFVFAAGAALTAAFLNAAFDFCLGCQIYLLLLRLR